MVFPHKRKRCRIILFPIFIPNVFSLSLPVQKNYLFYVSVLCFNNALILIYEKT